MGEGRRTGPIATAFLIGEVLFWLALTAISALWTAKKFGSGMVLVEVLAFAGLGVWIWIVRERKREAQKRRPDPDQGQD
jgi:uncharacterized membrane protein YdjX (TVP38/TMEM64 family)